ncbi:MAG: hypothetical protein JNM78_07175 [Cyclobacteriaceae bacterium]|nr:hypothetical protein [Cyclobacteriaceae bacterium]
MTKTLYEHFEELFHKGLSERKENENNADVFERVADKFEQLHGFQSPYSNYNSFKVITYARRKKKVCTAPKGC